MKLIDKDGKKTNLQPRDKIIYNFSQCRVQFKRGNSTLYLCPDGSDKIRLEGLVFELTTQNRFIKLTEIIASAMGLELKSLGGGPKGWECQFGKPS